MSEGLRLPKEARREKAAEGEGIESFVHEEAWNGHLGAVREREFGYSIFDGSLL
jgi:hypothetical protein